MAALKEELWAQHPTFPFPPSRASANRKSQTVDPRQAGQDPHEHHLCARRHPRRDCGRDSNDHDSRSPDEIDGRVVSAPRP